LNPWRGGNQSGREKNKDTGAHNGII
jgi:hypothetical protein